MAYEIPQQLQHKEKILFGLTFSQLAWASLFGAIILLIFTGTGSFTTKFILSIIPAILGILFIFFDVGTWSKRLFYFLKFRSAGIDDFKMKNVVQVKKIKDSIISSSKEVSILEVTPLNFGIRTDAEKESIIFGFQKFLNGLDFPVQIVVTTNNLNIDSYLDSLKNNSADNNLFSDFSDFIKSTIEKTQMRNRNFFLVIPKVSDLEIQTNVCKERLESIGLKTKRLNDRSLLNNLKLFFNDIEDKRTESDKETEGLHFLIAPNYIKDNVDSLQIKYILHTGQNIQ